MNTSFKLLFLGSVLGLTVQAQVTTTQIKSSAVSHVYPTQSPTEYAPRLTNLEAPVPGGDGYRDFLASQKIKSAQQFPATESRSSQINFGTEDDPYLTHQMPMTQYIAPIDLTKIYYGGTPLDNTMAFAGDYLLASVNSFLWGWNLATDSSLFVDQNGSSATISFAEFGKDFITDPAVEFPFDPKLAYIPHHEKFVFTFLSGRTPGDSKIIIGFSKSNDPRDGWNVYMIPGNPRNVDQWTDFPMFGYDSSNIFYSINLLQEGESWQAGFRGSIIWQVPMDEGFGGNDSLNLTMYDNINFGGAPIRNLTPVQPGYRNMTPNGMLFLSNRNFSLQNDSLFTIELVPNNGAYMVDINHHQLPELYGAPPNGLQANDNPNDDTDGLQTNDARYLGATHYVNKNNEHIIEFVGNTKSFSNARAGIYHGVIKEANNIVSSNISAQVITVDSLDFGYPNITYLNDGFGNHEGTMITFNHTAMATNAGVSGVYHSVDNGYSNLIRLKEGLNYVDRMSGTYERWGDYFGLQTDPNNPSRAYSAGFYGTSNRNSSTWFNEIYSPNPDFSTSTEKIEPETVVSANLYPNPVQTMVSVNFELTQNTTITYTIYNSSGQVIKVLGSQMAKSGLNNFSFTAAPLASGSYYLIISDQDGNKVVRKPFMKL